MQFKSTGRCQGAYSLLSWSSYQGIDAETYRQVVSDDCGAHSGYSGCSVKMRGPSLQNSFGDDFNENGGGTFAMLRDHSGIKVWFWPRGSYRPGDLARAKKEGTSRVDPTKWGTPAASFPSSGCAMSHFVGHVITINTSLCGTLGSGSAFNKAGCPGTCDDCVCIFAAGSDIDIEGIVTGCRTDVAGNPEAFKDAYWEINWLRTFTIPKED